jgi:hypothetical protein
MITFDICKLWTVVETVVILSGALKLNDTELGMPFDQSNTIMKAYLYNASYLDFYIL